MNEKKPECPLCGGPLQPTDGVRCGKCNVRVGGQIERNIEMAEIFSLKMQANQTTPPKED